MMIRIYLKPVGARVIVFAERAGVVQLVPNPRLARTAESNGTSIIHCVCDVR